MPFLDCKDYYGAKGAKARTEEPFLVQQQSPTRPDEEQESQPLEQPPEERRPITTMVALHRKGWLGLTVLSFSLNVTLLMQNESQESWGKAKVP